MLPSHLEETETLEMEEVEEEEEEEVEYEEVSEYEEVTEDEESEPQHKEQSQQQNPNPNDNPKPSITESIAHLESEEEEEEEEVEYEEVSEYEDEESEPQPKEQPQPQNPNPNNNPTLSIPEPIAQLQSLYTALSSFLHQYSSLHQTLDSINTSIPQSTPLNIELAYLKLICQLSAVKPLRKYIYIHLTDPDRLRQEVPEALKLSADPASLVLESMVNFYTRGRKAYERGDLQAIDVRRISILLLECYMIAGCPVAMGSVGSKKVVDSAMVAAARWRGRLVKEGGVEEASAVDALGLVLLVGGFGVPQEFTTMDLYYLLKLSNLKKKGDVLRRSRILVEKMPDIIKDLTAKEMHVEAVDLINAFRLEEKFPLVPLLSSFVEKTCEIGSEEIREGQCSTRSLKEANEKQLAALKLVLKCLKDHNIDASELSSLRITQKIAKCEKEILKFEDNLQEKNVKRKLEDVGPLKDQYNQAKQLRPFSAEASHGPVPQSIRPTQEQAVSGITDSRYPHNGAYIASNIPVSTGASHGLADRSNIIREQAVSGNTDLRYPHNGGYIASNIPASTGASHGLADRNKVIREQAVSGITDSRYPHNGGYIASNMPVSTGASHGLADRNNVIREQAVSGITDSRYPHNGGYIASNIPVSTRASHGLADRNNVRLLARNAHDSTGGWHANAAYQNSSGQSLLATPYPSGHDYSRSSAAAGQNYYQPTVTGQNYYQPTASGQNYYQTTAAGQNYYQTPSSSVVTGRNLYQFLDTIAERK